MLAAMFSQFPLPQNSHFLLAWHKYTVLTCYVGSMSFFTACGCCRVVSLRSTTWVSAKHRHHKPGYYHWQSSGLTTTHMYRYFIDERSLLSCLCTLYEPLSFVILPSHGFWWNTHFSTHTFHFTGHGKIAKRTKWDQIDRVFSWQQGGFQLWT